MSMLLGFTFFHSRTSEIAYFLGKIESLYTLVTIFLSYAIVLHLNMFYREYSLSMCFVVRSSESVVLVVTQNDE